MSRGRLSWLLANF